MNYRLTMVLPEGWRNKSSGVYTFVRQWVAHLLSRSDFEVVEIPAISVATSCSTENDFGPKAQAASLGKQRHALKSLRLFAGYLRDGRSEWRKISPLKKQLNNSVVIVNAFGAELRPLVCRLMLSRSKIVAIAHTHPNLNVKDFSIRRVVEHLCCWACSRVVFNSHTLLGLWERKLGRKISKGVVVHHGIPVPDVLKTPEMYPAKKKDVVDVVCVGLFYAWKGQLALIEAWPQIVQQSKVPLRLVLVGDGPAYAKAQQRVDELDLQNHVVFLGQQENGADFFNGADIAVHYPIEPEAFGLVLLEAMARAKPVIAPAHGGATEIVVDGETGYLVEPADGYNSPQRAQQRASEQQADMGSNEQSEWQRTQRGVDGGQWAVDSKEKVDSVNSQPSTQSNEEPRTKNDERLTLAEAICRLAEDAELRKRMGEAGRERVRNDFSVEKMLSGYDQVFRDIG